MSSILLGRNITTFSNIITSAFLWENHTYKNIGQGTDIQISQIYLHCPSCTCGMSCHSRNCTCGRRSHGYINHPTVLLHTSHRIVVVMFLARLRNMWVFLSVDCEMGRISLIYIFNIIFVRSNMLVYRMDDHGHQLVLFVKTKLKFHSKYIFRNIFKDLSRNMSQDLNFEVQKRVIAYVSTRINCNHVNKKDSWGFCLRCPDFK